MTNVANIGDLFKQTDIQDLNFVKIRASTEKNDLISIECRGSNYSFSQSKKINGGNDLFDLYFFPDGEFNYLRIDPSYGDENKIYLHDIKVKNDLFSNSWVGKEITKSFVFNEFFDTIFVQDKTVEFRTKKIKDFYDPYFINEDIRPPLLIAAVKSSYIFLYIIIALILFISNKKFFIEKWWTLEDVNQ